MRQLFLGFLGVVFFACLPLIIEGCSGHSPVAGPQEYVFSFETGMEGWSARGTDLDGPPVDWSIERSANAAAVGDWGLELFLDNLNDAGKIWAERSFAVQPGRRYRVEVQYDFGTRDFGSVNLWRIITGAHTSQPQTRDDLTFQGETGNGSDTDVGTRWLTKSYAFETTSDADGSLHVTVGVWGTYEVARRYYVDDIHVTLTPL